MVTRELHFLTSGTIRIMMQPLPTCVGHITRTASDNSLCPGLDQAQGAQMAGTVTFKWKALMLPMNAGRHLATHAALIRSFTTSRIATFKFLTDMADPAPEGVEQRCPVRFDFMFHCVPVRRAGSAELAAHGARP